MYIDSIQNLITFKKTESVMGWSFDTIPSTFKQFKEDSLLCYNETLTCGEYHLKFVEISWRSNHAWALYVDQDKQVSYLIKILIRKHQGCFGVKDIGEDAGPSVTQKCKPPKKFLKYPPIKYTRSTLHFREICDQYWNLTTTKDNFDVEAWKQDQIVEINDGKITIKRWLYSLLKNRDENVSDVWIPNGLRNWFWYTHDYETVLDQIATNLLK